MYTIYISSTNYLTCSNFSIASKKCHHDDDRLLCTRTEFKLPPMLTSKKVHPLYRKILPIPFFYTYFLKKVFSVVINGYERRPRRYCPRCCTLQSVHTVIFSESSVPQLLHDVMMTNLCITKAQRWEFIKENKKVRK